MSSIKLSIVGLDLQRVIFQLPGNLYRFLQELFSSQSNLYSERLGPNFDLAIEMDATPVPEEPHTLETFSIKNFNTLPKRTLSKALANSLRKRERDFPWSFSKVKHFTFFIDIQFQY